MKSPFIKDAGNHSISLLRSSLQKCILLALPVLLTIIQSCQKHDTNPPPAGSYDLKLIAENFVSPVTVVEAPDGKHNLYVVDQDGKVWIINADGTKMPNPFIDISNKMVALMPGYDERGLLGLAFHPDFQTNGKLYVFYTAPPHAGGPQPGASWDNLTRVSEFTISQGNPNQADLSTEKVIFEADHPEFNHDGGTIAFGPDNYLYISIGDGGNADDIGPGHVDDWYKVNAGGNGQDVEQNLLGNILRIDVDHPGNGKNYGIPPDNPFVNAEGMDEIFAYGFRNPYRFSFDQGGDKSLFAGDAGQSLYEEIDVVKKGGNYGWNVKEGTHCFSTANDTTEPASCPAVDSAGNPLIDPVIEVANSANPKGGETIAIVGGSVYRGASIPALAGKYIFGFLSADQTNPAGKILVSSPATSGLWPFEQLTLKSFPGNLGQYLKGFGQSLDGEIYALTSAQIGPQGATGKVYKLVLVP